MFSNPKKNLEQFDILPGQKVVDFGAGAGYYTFPLSNLVGPTGMVVALDVKKDLLLTIKREANKTHLFNVEAVWADLETPLGSRLKDASMERGVVSNFLFQVKNRENFVAEIRRVIKPGGKVLVTDWTDSFGGIGPDKKTIFPKENCRKLFLDNDFALEREIQAGVHHYGFVFKRN
jgi:ubiquinone/menaquinone biosynthesis C-methylase UbiE